MIAASAGHQTSMHNLRTLFVQGLVNRDAIDLTLTAYSNSCTEMRSEARDAFIRKTISNDSIGGRVRGVVFNTTRKGPDRLVVPIVTRFVRIMTKYT
jgi:hypothetical protein